ncbi:hypothetical protein C8R45DRAFT_1208888 [Mycena sanguinolenta]|nr:hypothetical protein C8R45DRAFT_1208888 [Mycena sanguinolenta]
MSGVSAGEETLIKFFLGPWLIGSCIELVLMGVLSCQLVSYYNWYPEDGRGLRLAVAILCILNLLKSGEGFASLWIFLIDHFGDIQYDLGLSITGWWDTANPLMVATLDFYVQWYFCTRLWAISRKSWVAAPIFLLFVFGLLSMVAGTYYIETAQEQQVTDWYKTFADSRVEEALNNVAVAAHLGSVFAGDVILSATTAFFLIRTKKTVLSTQTAELLRALIPLTFQTAAPAALIAMFNLVFSQMYRTKQPLLGFVEIGFNQVLPKLYAMSMMYTLNARRAIRSRVSGSRNGSGNGSSANEPSLGGRVQPRHANGDVELGRIHVSTQRETTVGLFNKPHLIGTAVVPNSQTLTSRSFALAFLFIRDGDNDNQTRPRLCRQNHHQRRRLRRGQTGSITLRHASEGGGNYAHHASKAALNMIGKLLSLDLKERGVAVGIVCRVFMRTDMTRNVGYDAYWDSGGAVPPAAAVASLLAFVDSHVTLERSGEFGAVRGVTSVPLRLCALLFLLSSSLFVLLRRPVCSLPLYPPSLFRSSFCFILLRVYSSLPLSCLVLLGVMHLCRCLVSFSVFVFALLPFAIPIPSSPSSPSHIHRSPSILLLHRDIGAFEPVMRQMGNDLPADNETPVRLPW